MDKFITKLASLALPFWMNKGEPKKLLSTARKFWTRVYDWMIWPLRQFDPLTCTESILNLIAYDRDITRFNGEPLSLFRKRVAYAFINARDAGSVSGFIAIFERLGIGYIELQERQVGIDWDIIVVRVTDSQLADNGALMNQIIRQYGRTCRRYQYEVLKLLPFYMRAGSLDAEFVCYSASIPGHSFFIYVGHIDNESVCHGASLL